MPRSNKSSCDEINTSISAKEVFTSAAFYLFVLSAFVFCIFLSLVAKYYANVPMFMSVLPFLGIIITYAYATFMIYFISVREDIVDLQIKMLENNTNQNLTLFRRIQVHVVVLFIVNLLVIAWLAICEFYLKNKYVLLVSSSFFPVLLVYTLIIFSGISKLAFWICLPLFLSSMFLPVYAYCGIPEEEKMDFLNKLDINGYYHDNNAKVGVTEIKKLEVTNSG